MLVKQNLLNLKQETKTIVIAKTGDNDLVKTIFTKLNIEAKDLKNDIEIIHSLKQYAFKKIIVLDEEKVLEKEKDLSKLFDLKTDLLILLDTFKPENIQTLIEGFVTSSYTFQTFKSKEKQEEVKFYYYCEKNFDEAISSGIVYGEAINNTKELVNKPYNYLNAKKLAEYALTFKELKNVAVNVYGKTACEDMKMGAFLGVNKGSKDEPQLIHIRYQGNKESKEITSLVGKGVMYDTGGYSLKTSTGMPTMKCDMAGAATVLGAIEIIAKLEFKANVDVVIAATDNRIGEDAIVPDDILTAANGTTIEITSTDAEGRLTLADALWFAQKEGAVKLIDIATLTGAVVQALGKEYTGVFTNNQDFLNELIKVSEKTKEKLWQMPMTEGYAKELKSYSADTRNTGTSRTAGASVAACFLEKFVADNKPWIHLDIAATAYDDKKGASGNMVKTLAEYFNQ